MASVREKLNDSLLLSVQTPAQYLGGELNAVVKEPDSTRLRFALAFPDTYAIGMSCLGLHVLYHVLNSEPDIAAERVFAPWPDMAEALRRESIPLYSLETYTPIKEFDIVGFSLQHELQFTNVLMMLDLAGIPLLAAERDMSHPLVIAGGQACANPEPLADFIDVFCPGDGEEVALAISQAVIEMRRDFRDRHQFILSIANRARGLYAPALYEPVRNSAGLIESIRSAPGAPRLPIRASRIDNLEKAVAPLRPIVPYVETVHDRVAIEIMRGCAGGCRFCQAGAVRRPVRHREPETILRIAEEAYRATGHEEINLASLSSSDYPHLENLLEGFCARFNPLLINFSLPSLRVGEQLRLLPRFMSQVRKSGLTIAPEAGTDRLRAVINKDITEDDLLKGVEEAFRAGWNRVKLYFMIGLPTETDEDIRAIPDLADKVSQLRRKVGGSPAQVQLSVAPFVPKAHTPFQWEPMQSEEYFLHALRTMLERLKNRAVQLSMHTPRRSVLEGVFARGDRTLGPALLQAARKGCCFDEWDEWFKPAAWAEIMSRAGIDPAFHANRARGRDEILPWDVLNFGISRKWLLEEREKAYRGEITPDCRRGPCSKCGACSPNSEG